MLLYLVKSTEISKIQNTRWVEMFGPADNGIWEAKSQNITELWHTLDFKSNTPVFQMVKPRPGEVESVTSNLVPV